MQRIRECHLVCGSDNQLLVIILNSIIVSIMIGVIILKRQVINKYIYTSLILIIAGGIGNIIDRVTRGYVIDYIDVNKLITYPVFNFADMLIVIGSVLLVISMIIDMVKGKQENGKS